MIHLPASVRVYLCLSPCDMRRSFDGLNALVRDHLELDALAGHLYLFANKRNGCGYFGTTAQATGYRRRWS